MSKGTTASQGTSDISHPSEHEILTRWVAEAGQLDFIGQRPMKVNRVLAQPKIRDEDTLLRFAVKHSQKTGHRTVVVVGALRLALIDNGECVGIYPDVMESLLDESPGRDIFLIAFQ